MMLEGGLANILLLLIATMWALISFIKFVMLIVKAMSMFILEVNVMEMDSTIGRKKSKGRKNYNKVF